MLENAIQALRRGDHAAAAEAAEAILKNEPGDVDALQVQGLARMGLGDADGARASLEQALARDPGRGDLHMALASLSMASGQLDAALAAASAAVEADPNHLPAYVALAHMALARGEIDEASRLVNLAELVSAEHPLTLLARGNLAQAKGEADQALRLLTQAVEKLPEDPTALSSLGLLHLQSGRNAFAEQTLRRALQADGQSRRIRWALVTALRRQGHLEEALGEVDTLCEGRRDPWAIAQRASLALELGRVDEAVAGYRDLLLSAQLNPRLLEAVLTGFAQHQRAGAACVLIEELLAARSDSDLLWRVRMGMAAQLGDDPGEIVDRWILACPESAEVQQHQAMRFEAAGELERAEAAADKALDKDAELDGAQLVKIRALLRSDPARAGERAATLLESRTNPMLRRELWRWRGLAADRSEDGAAAVEAWSAMAREPVPAALPPALDDPGSDFALASGGEAGVQPRLLWGLPGSRVMQVVELLRANDAVTLVDDRFGAGPRPDGFNTGRPELGPVDGDLPRWIAGVNDYGLDPAQVVDWMPHWNRAIDAGLPGARLLAVVRDPRDLLLNWWVFGSVQQYAFPGAQSAAQWLAAVLTPLAERLESRADTTLVLRLDEANEADARDALSGFIGIDPDALGAMPDTDGGRGGHPARFPAGHWRRYEGELGDVFASLAPLAQRLGF
ncbi:tetratricopeptide repeat protein [Alkalisalibacterium limincola]|uniref:Tetratricopeptide repeat protein n=1 Tax=Alkalisalibacterium limincola TaxID=2699169 RepID=A0A5C8KN74_9GAMM|nr:tetratricopeptide repeat protein [Alkalisalibacterium limincola]TXK60758.1 tetratricopeptide repeat protein [Alkalisalibacterium limincola]